jgi:zinc protease
MRGLGALLLITAGAAIVPAAPQATAPARGPAATPKPAAKTAAPAKPAAVPSYRDLKFPPLPSIPVPKVATFTLPNGLKLFLLEDRELPLISGTARVRTGNLFEPAGKVGLASITGMVMRSGGTSDRTGDELDEQLENMAASVESSIGETSGSVSFTALKENADEVMAVFQTVLTQPEFRQEKIDLAKSQFRSSIARRNDDPHGVALREFSDMVYGKDTPYGRRIEYATIDRITRADLQEFHRRYYFPANILMAVWGDFDSAQMKAKLEKLFGDWDAKQPPVPDFPKVSNTPAPGTYLAVKQDVTQTFFVIGHFGGVLRDADYPALEIMSDILGGGFRSRLFQRVRTRMGAAYSVSANWGANYNHPGLFTISGSTKSMSTVDTIKAIQEEIERIRTSEVTEAELETAKETALNSLVFAFDTKTETLGRMLNYEYYGYPQDFLERYQKALAAVTRADVLRVAKEHIRPANLLVMTVGKPAEFGTPLEALGRPVTLVDLTIPEPKAESAKADQESLEAGRKLLQRVQQAVGGADKLAGVKDFSDVIDFRLDAASGGMRVKQTDRWIAPTHFRQDSQLPNGRISAYSDGATGWIVTPQGSGPLEGAQLKQVQGDLFRLYFRLLLSDRLGRQVNYIGEDTIEINEPGGETARLTVDPATGLPSRLVYQSVHAAGPPVTVQDAYSDFRDVDGIKIPFLITITQGGRKFAEVVVEEYKLNSGLKVEEVSQRPQ